MLFSSFPRGVMLKCQTARSQFQVVTEQRQVSFCLCLTFALFVIAIYFCIGKKIFHFTHCQSSATVLLDKFCMLAQPPHGCCPRQVTACQITTSLVFLTLLKVSRTFFSRFSIRTTKGSSLQAFQLLCFVVLGGAPIPYVQVGILICPILNLRSTTVFLDMETILTFICVNI